jgi:hypothetical protein
MTEEMSAFMHMRAKYGVAVIAGLFGMLALAVYTM